MQRPKPLTDEEIVHIESLVKSPVYGALKRCLDIYRFECISQLCTSKDVNKLFEIQGRIIGATAIENLPAIYLEQTMKGKKREEERTKRAGAGQKPPGNPTS